MGRGDLQRQQVVQCIDGDMDRAAFCDGGPCTCFYSFDNGNPEGQRYCTEPTIFCTPDMEVCTDNSQCPEGYVCASSCCNNYYGQGGLCLPACGSGAGLRARNMGDTEGFPSPILP